MFSEIELRREFFLALERADKEIARQVAAGRCAPSPRPPPTRPPGSRAEGHLMTRPTRKAAVCLGCDVPRPTSLPRAAQRVTFTGTFSPKVAGWGGRPAARSLPRPPRPGRTSPLFP